MPETITPFEIPVLGTGDILGVISGVNTWNSFISGDIVGALTGGIFGGGLFGGGGHHEVNVGGLVVPSNMTGLGISTAPINAGSFRDFGAINQSIVSNLLTQVSNISREFVAIGFKQSPLNLALAKAHLAVGRSATSPDHQRALNQNLINLASQVIIATAQIKANRISYLAGSESERERLSVFVQTNPANAREITNSFFELMNTPHELRVQRRLRDLTGKSLTFLDTLFTSTFSNTITADNAVIAVPLPDTNVTNVTNNYFSQTTLTNKPFVGPPQPKAPANPNTKASWWQKFITAGRVASGIHTAVTLPFTLKNFFFPPETEQPIFSSIAGSDEFFFPDFPIVDSSGQPINPLLFLQEDGSFNVEKLSDENIVDTAGTVSGKTISYLLLGLLIAYLIAKRKGRK